MDTVRADHLSLFGYERDTTPNLREFARGATVYSRAMATSDFTLPTHASIFTGLYPGYYGPIYTPPDPNPAPLPSGHATLAELTRAQGYFTLEVAANYAFLAEGTGLTRGFLHAELKYPTAIAGRVSRFYLGNSAEALLGRWINTADFERPFLGAAEISTHAEELIALAAPGRPFFLFLNLMDAHAPYIPQEPFDTRFLGSDSRVPDPFSLFGRVNLRGHPASDSVKSRLISQYDGGIAAEDDAIGKLVRHLRDRGLYDNTLIVITSDHGEEFGEHGFLSHNLGFVYETNLHVPLLVKYPLQMEAKRSDVLVNQVDILPTVLESADIPPPASLQGRSLARRQSGESSVVFALSEAPSSAHGNPKLRGSRQAVLEDSQKLIVWTNGPPELYDLALDPGERHNLYQPDDPRAADLSKRLTAWISSMPRPVQRNSHNLDKETIEKLKSLGYVQ
jgi:arylsulfatase A-like enzyme